MVHIVGYQYSVYKVYIDVQCLNHRDGVRDRVWTASFDALITETNLTAQYSNFRLVVEWHAACMIHQVHVLIL